jgi:hypothetical protein
MECGLYSGVLGDAVFCRAMSLGHTTSESRCVLLHVAVLFRWGKHTQDFVMGEGGPNAIPTSKSLFVLLWMRNRRCAFIASCMRCGHSDSGFSSAAAAG